MARLKTSKVSLSSKLFYFSSSFTCPLDLSFLYSFILPRISLVGRIVMKMFLLDLLSSGASLA